MKRIYFPVSLIITLFLLFACGGGSGGGDDSEPPPLEEEINYTGLKSPAVITTGNADELAAGIFNTDTDVDTSIVGVVIDENTTNVHVPLYSTLSRALTDAVKRFDFHSVLSGAIVTQEETQQCDSGTVDMYIEIDDVTGGFDGYMSYNDCVRGDMYTDGTIDFVGRIDLNNTNNIQMTMTFTHLIESYGAESNTYKGKIFTMETLSTYNQVIDYLVRNNMTDSIFMYEDYRINLTDMYSHVAMTLNGRYYHPSHGYIDIITSDINNIIIEYYQYWPGSGIVTATGDNSSFKIDCEGQDINTYTLAVDADGDGDYEYANIKNW